MSSHDTTRVEASVEAWLGLRYAHAGRFQAPTLVEYDPDAPTDHYGSAPWQFAPPVPPLGADVDEDCHFLNVWSPTDRESLLPVYVCVYGGGFEHGAASSWVCDGTALAATGRVVVVSLNYRVGALGFLSLDAHGPGFTHTHNLGLQDVVVALRWIRENVARFGGDPDRVTVVGESAGGFLAAALPAVPAADGLYQALAVFSAGASRIVPNATAHETADRLLAELGIDDPELLREMPVAELVRAQSKVLATDIGVRNGPTPRAFGIVDDSTSPHPVLDGHPARAWADGRTSPIRLLASATHDEIALFRAATRQTFDPASLEEVVAEARTWGVSDDAARALVQDVRHGLAEPTPGAVREALLTDYVYRLPIARLALAQAGAGGSARLLLIGRADELPAGHACDVAGLIGGYTPDGGPGTLARDELLTEVILGFVTAETDSGWPEVGPDRSTARVLGAGDPETFSQVLTRWDGVPRP